MDSPNQISCQHLEELVVEALQRLIRLQQTKPTGHLKNIINRDQNIAIIFGQLDILRVLLEKDKGQNDGDVLAKIAELHFKSDSSDAPVWEALRFLSEWSCDRNAG